MTAEDGAARVTAVECASPPCVIDQQSGLAFMERHHGDALSPRGLHVLRKAFSHPSIRQRHFAFERPEQLLAEDPDQRMDRFRHWAVRLSAAAAARSMSAAGLAPQDVSALVVNTCTGYLCPGVSSYLVEELGLSRGIRAYDLVGAGCGGAVPNLQLCASQLSGPRAAVLSVAVEICSATYQMADDPSLIISNAIFGDGAAAAVVWGRPDGLALVDSRSLHAPEYREDIRYVYRGGQLHNQLSPRLPRKAAGVVGELISQLLGAHGLRSADVPHWALHAGGDRVLGALQEKLGLSDEQVGPCRHVLREYGNLSSVSAWFVLREALDRGVRPGDWCVMLAFGAGMSAHACLLRA